MEKKRFDGACVVITGGAGEIGRATAELLAQEGANIALIDRMEMQNTEDTLQPFGVNVKSYRCDVADWQQVCETLDSIIHDFGRISHLFNNAGVQGEFAPIHLYPENDFASVITINLVGAFHVLKAVSAHMVDNGGGSIVNTASMAGVGAPVNMAAYGASKHGIIGLTKIAAKDLAPYNVRVNAVSPGYMGPGFMWERQVDLQAAADSQYFSNDPAIVAQEMVAEVPMRRYGTIDEIPPTVSFLLSEDASYITGVNIKLSGGI